jgi:hypothetical protein
VHDLLAAKAIAGREKDIDFLTEAAKHGLAQKNELLSRLALVEADRSILERAQALVRRLFPYFKTHPHRSCDTRNRCIGGERPSREEKSRARSCCALLRGPTGLPIQDLRHRQSERHIVGNNEDETGRDGF